MKILYTHFLITIFAFSITSCSNSNEAEVPAASEEVGQIEEESTSEVVEDHMFYQVPTPNELFAVLKNAEVAYNRENLNDISNVNKYETKASKALNFGVYTADLAYITSLGQMDDASKFLKLLEIYLKI